MIKIEKSWALLSLIFLVVVLSVFIKVIFNESGYLSNDSTNYLFLAKNLTDGHGFYVRLESGGEDMRGLFSSWPVGYPYLIAVISKISGLSVFMSSKILNVIFIGFVFVVFRKLFAADAWVYALIFLFSSYLEIYSFTWSEAGFIFGLVLFSYSLYEFLGKKTNLYFSSLLILFSVFLLFLIRYMGAFTVGVLGLLLVYLVVYKRYERERIVLISFLIAFNIMFVIWYLYFNYLETGLLSGRERFFAPESNYELLLSLIKAILAEISVPVYHPRPSFVIPSLFIQVLLAAYFLYKNRGVKCLGEVSSLEYFSVSRVFFIVGVLYLFCIVSIRWIFYFNEYSFRLLGPGTFLMFVSAISYLSVNLTKSCFDDFKKIIVVLSLISFFLYVPVKTYFRFQQSYDHTLYTLSKKYEHLPIGSILAFEQNKHLKYVRSDLIIKKPSSSEKLFEFYNRVNERKVRRVFVEVSDKINLEKYDNSFSKLFSKHQSGDVVEIFSGQDN